MDFGKILTKVGDTFTGGLVSGVTDAFSKKATTKITGIPTPNPDPYSGEDYRNFLDEAFPGTDPYSRLGASTPAGTAISAENASKVAREAQQNAREMQRSDLDNRSSVADSNNRAMIISHSASLGPPAVASNLATYGSGFGTNPAPYDSPTAQHREETDSKKPGWQADSHIAQAKADLASPTAEAELDRLRSQSIPTTIYGLLSRAGRFLRGSDSVNSVHHKSIQDEWSHRKHT